MSVLEEIRCILSAVKVSSIIPKGFSCQGSRSFAGKVDTVDTIVPIDGASHWEGRFRGAIQARFEGDTRRRPVVHHRGTKKGIGDIDFRTSIIGAATRVSGITRGLGPIAAIYAATFQVFFYSAVLFNSGAKDEDRITRLAVLERSLGPSEPDNPNLFADAARRMSEPSNLWLRAPIFLAATFIVALALLIGELARLALRIPPEAGGLDRFLMDFAVGMAAVSLLTQVLGLFGVMSRALLFVVAAVLVFVVPAISWSRRLEKVPRETMTADTDRSATSIWFRVALLSGMFPFVVIAFFAASLPTTDYDALGYHLLGPKEYWLEGRITFLPHNVYTTFPFFTEMFSLLGMIVLDDWFTGGLAGQVVLCCFGSATALAVGRLGTRLFGQRAGWLAAFVYLTTPWTYRLSTIPYVEGALLFYAVMAIAAARAPSRPGLLAGIYSGSAMACKYPGLILSVLPAAGFLVFRNPKGWRRGSVFFLMGISLAVGPWLVRNAYWTGNPVYPLLQRHLGGSGWSEERIERFDRAHRASEYSLPLLLANAREIAVESDWQSGLVFAFAPLAFLLVPRREALLLGGLVTYQFAAFWLFTHRLDRFWLPLEPFVAILAGAGMIADRGRLFRGVVAGSLVLGFIHNLAYCTSGLCGLANYTEDIHGQRKASIASFWPAVAVANEPRLVPPGSTVLFVGFAAVHDAEPRSLYNTTFDDNLLESLARKSPGEEDLKDPMEIRRELAARGIDFLLVDWTWIQRYRSPGNYGFTPFVQPELFAKLVSAGVLTKVSLYPPGISREPIELYRVVGEDAMK